MSPEREAAPGWGRDERYFDGWSLASAHSVARILLPLRSIQSGAACSWRDAAALLPTHPAIDGSVSWAQLSEVPGNGGRAPLAGLEPAAGELSEAVADDLVAVMSVLGPATWTWRPDPIANWQDDVLHDWSPEAGVASGRPQAPSRLRAARGAVTGDLAAMAGLWRRRGFSGHAWSAEVAAAVAAPPYADSLIVSGGAALSRGLSRSALEFFVVDRWTPVPPLAW